MSDFAAIADALRASGPGGSQQREPAGNQGTGEPTFADIARNLRAAGGRQSGQNPSPKMEVPSATPRFESNDPAAMRRQIVASGDTGVLEAFDRQIPGYGPAAPVPAPPAAAQGPADVAQAAENPGLVASAAAGAGKAFGSGVLAVQQLAGKGLSYAGDIAGSDQAKRVGDWLSTDATQGAQRLATQNAPYEEANPKANIGGQIVGIVANPINKIIPVGGPSSTLIGAGLKGAGQGAALNTLTSPVTDESQPFLIEKGKQALIGAFGGVAGGTLGYGLSAVLNKGIDVVKSAAGRLVGGNSAAAAEGLVSKTLADVGVDKASIPPELFAGLKAQVQTALASGKPVDPKELMRLTRAQTLPVPVPMLKGQISRDPMQFAKEQNLRGIQGVGEPITQTLQAQNHALIANLDAMGASKGADVVSAGKAAIESLQAADAKAQAIVSGAYDAFKNTTGKSLDVPLRGLAQDYAKTVSEFGDAIPSAIKGKFESLGLLSGKARSTFSIEDAEALIKSINRNYDPKNIVQARALNELRDSLQTAIADGAGSTAQGAEAAFLAKSAREAASLRFASHKATPALRDAVGGAEPDKFIQKHILQGNERQIGNMMDTLAAESPAAVVDLQNALMAHIKGRVLNRGSDGNAVFSQAQLKQFVSDPNASARLAQVLGPEKMAQLRQLNQVAEDALFAPKASAVNNSNTASAAANLIKEEVGGGAIGTVLSFTRNIPGLAAASDFARQTVQSRKAAGLVGEAVNPSLNAQGGATALRDLSDFGARSGAAATGSAASNARRKHQQ